MIIETKFNVDDTFWVIQRNAITKCKVVSIKFEIDNHTNKSGYIMYSPTFAANWNWIPESRCFKTKEELIESL